MPSLRLLLAGLLLAAVCAAPAAAASPTQLPPGITIPKVTGLKLVGATAKIDTDWKVIPDRRFACSAYVRGDGTQYIEVELKRPADYALVQIGKTIQLYPSNRLPRFTSAMTRLFDWDRKLDECACGPNSEYGECGPPAPQPTFDCTPRPIAGARPMIDFYNGPPRSTGELTIDDLLGPDVAETTLTAIVRPAKEFGDCAPSGESAGHALELHMLGAATWDGRGWIDKLASLRSGRRHTLSARVTTGVVHRAGSRNSVGHYGRRCPAKPRAGTWMCDRTEVRLTFQRR